MTSKSLTSVELRRRLAANVRRLRTAAPLTIKQAAGRAEVHWRHWQKIEAAENNATLATLIRVAEALNVTVAELLEAPAEPKPSE
jgi:XRE family transcriptional regulator, regulator of sulfur utilization